jgi:hypothetical protein
MKIPANIDTVVAESIRTQTIEQTAQLLADLLKDDWKLTTWNTTPTWWSFNSIYNNQPMTIGLVDQQIVVEFTDPKFPAASRMFYSLQEALEWNESLWLLRGVDSREALRGKVAVS